MAKQNEKKETPTHVVTTEFRDINNFDVVYEVGDDVSDFEEARLANLVSLGYVKGSEAEQAPPPPPAV